MGAWRVAQAEHTREICKEMAMARLNIGDKAPGFTLRDQVYREISLSDFQGHKVLLYFYPKAGTSGCMKQAISVRDSAEDLHRAGITAVGISPDMPEQQLEFDKKHGLGFPLLSDPDHSVAEAYGVWDEGKQGISRSSFLIDEQGNILQANYSVKPEDTVPKAMKALAEVV
jgi:thioredoxin-dependent peroxiredoxin